MKLFADYVIHTRSGQSIAGSVRRRRGRWIVLAQASLLNGGDKPVPLDGEVVIPRENVDFAQRTTTRGAGS